MLTRGVGVCEGLGLSNGHFCLSFTAVALEHASLSHHIQSQAFASTTCHLSCLPEPLLPERILGRTAQRSSLSMARTKQTVSIAVGCISSMHHSIHIARPLVLALFRPGTEASFALACSSFRRLARAQVARPHASSWPPRCVAGRMASKQPQQQPGLAHVRALLSSAVLCSF